MLDPRAEERVPADTLFGARYQRIVFEEITADDVWWGKVNVKLDYKSFLTNREHAVDYLNTRQRLYIIDGFGGWEEEFHVPVRIITSRANHAIST